MGGSRGEIRRRKGSTRIDKVRRRVDRIYAGVRVQGFTSLTLSPLPPLVKDCQEGRAGQTPRPTQHIQQSVGGDAPPRWSVTLQVQHTCAIHARDGRCTRDQVQHAFHTHTFIQAPTPPTFVSSAWTLTPAHPCHLHPWHAARKAWSRVLSCRARCTPPTAPSPSPRWLALDDDSLIIVRFHHIIRALATHRSARAALVARAGR